MTGKAMLLSPFPQTSYQTGHGGYVWCTQVTDRFENTSPNEAKTYAPRAF